MGILAHRWALRHFAVWTGHEFALAFRRLRGVDARRVRDYLANHPIAKLQLSAGSNLLEGWLNTNWFPLTRTSIFLDARERFPLPDSSFDVVFSEHMIEHLEEEAGAQMIRECFRVLKPGGRLRISTPDINFLIRLLRPGLSELEKRYLAWQDVRHHGSDGPSPIGTFNMFVRNWGHLFIYAPGVLTDSLRASGFIGIEQKRICESDHPALAQLENVTRLEPGFLELETMTLEATKPG